MTDVRAALLHLDGRYEIPAAAVGARGPAPLVLPATPLASLGDPRFLAVHGARFPYMAGAMANGIASVELVTALARAGMVAVFGAAGLALERVDAAIASLQRELGGTERSPWGVNLIHSPSDAPLEDALARLCVQRDVRLVEASAFLKLTLPVVRYRVSGLRRGADGRVVAPRRLVAKVSRVEVATPFLSPPPDDMLAALVAEGAITPEGAALAREIPMADDLTAEADSGGHTDNRPALALVPTMIALRDRLQERYRYASPSRIGAAGGIATPAATAAAFAMGAAYVVTGTVNQACIESGSSDLVRRMLAEAQQADVAMAPAADMFEMGVKVQVLKRGTMFPMRAAKLYELYSRHRSLDEIPPKDREQLETQLFRESLEAAWEGTRAFFERRDPRQLERAARDPRHKMALVFRSYLGRASRWANDGVAERKVDYQVWCGPAMGAFNEWVKGSFLENPTARRVSNVAMNLLVGAAVLQRANVLRAQGADPALLPARWTPLPDGELSALLERGAEATT